MSLLEALTKLVDDELKTEIINGCSLFDTLPAVDLSMAFSPVLPHRTDDNSPYVPQPVEAMETQGGKSYILHYSDGRAETVSAESLKVMRCRFLLTRDYYFQRLLRDSLSHTEKQMVISHYFDGAVWLPPEGPMREAMKTPI